jgi:diguanylate cyclase (GGDEF)-like protein/PAS domain S-box-containing protein
MHPTAIRQGDERAGIRQIAHRLIWLLFGLAIAAQVMLMAIIVLGHGADSTIRTEVLGTVTMAAAAAGTLLAGVVGCANGVRWPWVALGTGLVSYALGGGYFFFVQKTLTTFPTTADFFWLSIYPFVLAAIVLLVREQRKSDRLEISLDAAIVALAVGALAYELLFDRLLNVEEVSGLIGGQLAYSVLDLAVVTMLVLVAAQSRGQAGKAYLVLALGALAFLATDLTNVKQLVTDSYAPGTMLDAGWPAGVLLFALASRFGTSLPRVGALRGWRLYVAVRQNDRLARDNEAIITAAGEGIFRTDLWGRITYANPAALKMLGYTSQEVLGRRSHELFHHTRPNGTPYPASQCPAGKSLSEGASHRVTDELYWRKDGTSIAVDYTTAPIREGGKIVGVVTVFDDVTGQRQLKEQLRHQADHDSLTGLYNRWRFEKEVSGQLSYAQRYLRSGVLLLLDIDSFKFVNDSYGHPAGDKLLCEVGAILSAKVRETDVAARIGADEFAVLLREADESEGIEIAKGLIAAIRSETKPTIGASIGIAPFDGDEQRTPDELLVAADIALYKVKEAGGGEVAVYSGESGQVLTWVEQIRSALDEQRLAVYSQPIVDVGSGEVAREELLVRMVDADGDKIPPIVFLPTAERVGLIHEIDLVVLRRAIELVRTGRPVAVNVSTRSLTDQRFIGILEKAIEAGAEPGSFNFEITETAAVANMADAQEFANRIRELGCSLALDDFGTGFSSFIYLKHVPAQFLKIDIEFIRDLERSPADQQLVRAIVSIAHGLGQKTVAEGVENRGTLEMVRKLGVDYAQGFYIGRPALVETGRVEARSGRELTLKASSR